METQLFVYGSLIFPEVWEGVIAGGKRHRRMVANADGFVARRVEGETYPGLVADSGRKTDGVLIFDLSVEDWELLDGFEGEFYERAEIEVCTENGERCRAQTYLVAAGFGDQLSNEVWDADQFAKGGLAEFMARFV